VESKKNPERKAKPAAENADRESEMKSANKRDPSFAKRVRGLRRDVIKQKQKKKEIFLNSLGTPEGGGWGFLKG